MPEPAERLALVTCSMARDRDLFALLARSVDAHIPADIPHRVVVPASDMAVFRAFGSPRREIIAQEDVLPFRTVKIPNLPRALGALAGSFRRPFYVDRKLRMIRGWILQQILKIEMSRLAPEDAVIHVDSDVFFFRPMTAANVFHDGRPAFFAADGQSGNPRHGEWVQAAARVLGASVPADHRPHYIENCVTWSTAVLRDLVGHVENRHSRPWHQVLLAERSFSEYYLYGLYLDHVAGLSKVARTSSALCRSYWPAQGTTRIDLAALLANAGTTSYALAIQSTEPLPLTERIRLFEMANPAVL